ncbi:ABC transporter permease [uncultured Limosilactobacillus sp.]|uniref:ABC transporter permease n=1 Tax=uncultured Limosilactobacillus sp. TaxID=2837629 RepID=UPI0025EFA9B7|nr:ABC transporter permease [uncultured Limosilactobacillus sp.]
MKQSQTVSPFEFVNADILNNHSGELAEQSLSFRAKAWCELRKNKTAMISLAFLSLVAAVSLMSFVWMPHNPNTQNVSLANLHPFQNTSYLLGTDNLGRDMFSRLLYGTRISLMIAIFATVVDIVIGVPYGLVSGWCGGRVDNIMQRMIEIISSIPELVLIMLLLIIFKPGLISIVFAIALGSWVLMARLVRASAMQLKNADFVLAARSMGESPLKIAWHHILPNTMGVIITRTMFTIPAAIFLEALLSFIGIGVKAPNASLGTLLNAGEKGFQFYQYQLWEPVIILSLMMIAFNLLGDGLRDAFDPNTKR